MHSCKFRCLFQYKSQHSHIRFACCLPDTISSWIRTTQLAPCTQRGVSPRHSPGWSAPTHGARAKSRSKDMLTTGIFTRKVTTTTTKLLESPHWLAYGAILRHGQPINQIILDSTSPALTELRHYQLPVR